MSKYYFVSVPATFNNCLTLRLGNSLAPVVNRQTYPDKNTKKNSNEISIARATE